ncbi:MAG: tetratricopeptide repeat protein [Bradymonadaceae bacterium]
MPHSQEFKRCSHLLAGIALISLVLGGCATTSTKTVETDPTEVAEEHIELDPMLVRVKNRDTLETETLDVEELFTEAYVAYQNRRYEEAVRHYDVIIAYFPTSRFYLPALYNGGLAYEQLQYWDQAAKNYQRIIEAFPDQKEAIDAHYRLANVFQELGNYAEVVELMTLILLRDLEHFDRIEAHLRRANALRELGELTEAEQAYRTLLRLNDDAPEDQKISEDAHFLVQSYFGIGRIYHMRVGEIRLVLPPERMGDDLQEKAELFLRAQSNYIRALRYHHPHWSVAAGYMIGKMYEDFYMDMFRAEIPDDLTEEQVILYFEELGRQIKPLMERAIQVYERNLSLSQRIVRTDEAEKWIEATAMHLTRMRAFLNDPTLQQRAQKLVVSGRDIDDLWDLQGLARHFVQEALGEARRKADENKELQSNLEGPTF